MSSSHHYWVGQTQAQNISHVSVGEVRVGERDPLKLPGSPPLLDRHTPTSREASTSPTKNYVHQKIAHILITSLRTSFTTVAHVISVSYILKNSRKHWRDSRKIIHLFVPPGIINPSTSRLDTLKLQRHLLCVGRQTPTPWHTPTWPQY